MLNHSQVYLTDKNNAEQAFKVDLARVLKLRASFRVAPLAPSPAAAGLASLHSRIVYADLYFGPFD